MTGKVFVDTNVFVYARDASETEKQPKAAEWLAHLWKRGLGAISFQVLQEYYVTVTRKLQPGMKPEAARKDIRDLLAWSPVAPGVSVIEQAWACQDRFGLSWWDALIVAAAQAADCQFLLSEDFQEGQVFGSLKVLHPFLRPPAAEGR